MSLQVKILFLFFLSIHLSESTDPTYYSCNGNSNTTQKSRNINYLLTELVSNTIQNGFISTSYGTGSDQIYGLAQCRGDVSKNDCSICIKDAAESARKLCPNQVEVKIWYDYCFLRYDTLKFFGQVDTSGLYLYNVQNVTDADVFNKKLGSLIDQIDSEAIKSANEGLGKGKSKISEFLTLYALVQCTRDLSSLSCAQCLAIAIENFSGICNDKKGCRVLYGSCYVRYELYPFYFPLDSNEILDRSFEKYKSVVAFEP
ncbi:hypothetical protein ACJIZ3_017751 [Penstemon smallii]|uniref:Gnk2-homologous domain-containing protein n=1 Tax=Penstemon smallii TaxID=265156 RepID=A0ABD3SWF7_9LAMI